MKNTPRKIAVTLMACCLTLPAIGSAATFTITGTQTIVDANNLVPKPVGGDLVLIQAGTRKALHLKNFTGSAGNPIVFRNSGGQVVISDTNASAGLNFSTCKYFRVTGTGDPAHYYGIKVSVTKDGSMGVNFGVLSTDFEIDHVEVASAGFAGVMSKTDPGCDPSAHRGNFIQKNTYFHDLYIHDVGGEGFYVGNTSWSGKTITCSGTTVTVYPHEIHNVSIYNNVVNNTGWDGIQLSCATQNATIEGNYVSNFGLENASGQNQGIQLGAGSAADVFNNTIDTGRGGGIVIFALGGNRIFNNIVYMPDGDGIFCDDRATNPGTGFYFDNNTIVSPGRHGISMYSDQTTGNTFYNNIVVSPGRLVSNSKYVYKLSSSVQLLEANNYTTTAIADVKFVNASGRDYHLQPTSPAVNAGRTVSAYNYDYDNLGRPSGSAYDIGATEQVGSVFLQNFDGIQSAGTYANSTAPTTGQFNNISSEANGGTWSVTGGKLQLVRSGSSGSSNGAGFTRHTDFGGPPSVLYVNFDLEVTNFNTFQNDSVVIDFCSATGVSDYNGSTPSTSVFSSLRIDGVGNNTFKFELNGTQSTTFPANATRHEVSVYLNKSGSSKSYRAPDGTMKTLNNNAASLWVGTTAVLQNIAAPNGSTSALTDLRARFVAPDAATWRFDNVAIFASLPQ